MREKCVLSLVVLSILSIGLCNSIHAESPKVIKKFSFKSSQKKQLKEDFKQIFKFHGDAKDEVFLSQAYIGELNAKNVWRNVLHKGDWITKVGK